ncbi:HPr kinase/phosphorylase [Jiella sp. M17.18]|uniref:HPr kinase/phosphorylase n=1 Tax=Jiella sp. M17.18 TaxID=3234247 RepID=UPI0034DE63B2
MSGTENIHGSAIALRGSAVLVRGPARCGKSALCLSALRRGAALGLEPRLVADDRVLVRREGAAVILSAPPQLKGLIEISGVGILTEPAIDSAPLTLVADLCPPEAIERYPDEREAILAGVPIRLVRLPMRDAAFGADVLVSLALALQPPG